MPCHCLRAPDASLQLAARRSLCTQLQATAKGRSLGHIDPEYRNEVANILERAEACMDSWTPIWTRSALHYSMQPAQHALRASAAGTSTLRR